MSLDKGKGTEQTKKGQPVRLEETGWGVVTGGGLVTKERKHFQEVGAPGWPTRSNLLTSCHLVKSIHGSKSLKTNPITPSPSFIAEETKAQSSDFCGEQDHPGLTGRRPHFSTVVSRSCQVSKPWFCSLSAYDDGKFMILPVREAKRHWQNWKEMPLPKPSQT